MDYPTIRQLSRPSHFRNLLRRESPCGLRGKGILTYEGALQAVEFFSQTCDLLRRTFVVPAARVMRPDREPPLQAAHEVGVVVADAQVVDGLVFTGVEEVFDRDPPTVVARQQIADRDFSGRQPALAVFSSPTRN